MTTTLPDPTSLSDAELEIWLRLCTAQEERRRYVWSRFAREDQLPPKGKWLVWFLMGGRGSGKTRTGSETAKKWGKKRPNQHIAVVAKTHREVLNICFEAPRAGLVAVIEPWEVVQFLRGSGSVAMTMANGSILRAFSAQDPEAMRGYAFDKVWLDEYAAFPPKMAQLTYDMAWFCMRESPEPQMIITSTPKPLPHVKKLMNLCLKRPWKYVLTRSKTSDNRANLSAATLAVLDEAYAGTRLGRQELDAELLEDVEGALWQLRWIENSRVLKEDVPELLRRVVAVDPAETVSETSDETGIVVAGLGTDGHVYVLDDRSAKTAGLSAAMRIWQAWIDWECEWVVVEASGLWMRDTLEIAWRALQDEQMVPPGDPPIRELAPFASKKMRAAPVAAKYERGDGLDSGVHHVETFPHLEEQQITWTPEEGDSPDRLDALVYAVSDLLGMMPKQASVASVTSVATAGVPGNGRRPVGPGAAQAMGVARALARQRRR